jgi:hypothetical protein
MTGPLIDLLAFIDERVLVTQPPILRDHESALSTTMHHTKASPVTNYTQLDPRPTGIRLRRPGLTPRGIGNPENPKKTRT